MRQGVPYNGHGLSRVRELRLVEVTGVGRRLGVAHK